MRQTLDARLPLEELRRELLVQQRAAGAGVIHFGRRSENRRGTKMVCALCG